MAGAAWGQPCLGRAFFEKKLLAAAAHDPHTTSRTTMNELHHSDSECSCKSDSSSECHATLQCCKMAGRRGANIHDFDDEFEKFMNEVRTMSLFPDDIEL